MLERLGMIGASWRRGGSESLAGFSLPTEQREARLADFADAHGLAEIVYIGTCNRVELVFVHADAVAASTDLRAAAWELLTGTRSTPGEARRHLRAWAGEGALEHLFLVTAALDSACLGEAEIAGQVRAAHDAAREHALSGKALDPVFEAAFRVGAQVRTETALASGRVSLAEIAADELAVQQRACGGRIALVGVSPMTEKAAAALATRDIPLLIVNRTAARAAALAGRHGAQSMLLDDFRREGARDVCALLSATGAPNAVVGRAALERLQALAPRDTLLVVDMAVPPDVAPEACRALGLRRIGMDDIAAVAARNRGARQREAATAREIVDEALTTFIATQAERRYGTLIGNLQRRYQHTAESGVERLLGRELAGLGEAERDAVRRWARVLARRFAHIPCVGLRGLLRDGPDGALEAFVGGLDPELADELFAAPRHAPTEARG